MMREEIDTYLAVRRSVGFDLGIHEWMLHDFERFATARGDVHVCQQTAIEWASLAPSSGQQERRLGFVRGFARHAVAENPANEIPPPRVFRKVRPKPRPVVYLYSTDDIRRILKATSHLEPGSELVPGTFSTLFGLLSATGMRVSEALAMTLADITADGLLVKRTKFRKSRLLPLHETTQAALDSYVRSRMTAPGPDNDHLFLSATGRTLGYTKVNAAFLRIVRELGLHPGPGLKGPRLHDFRHTFAVRALEKCPPASQDHVSRHLLALSTYLGHSTASHTYWYLQLTPQLTSDIADACENFLKEVHP